MKKTTIPSIEKNEVLNTLSIIITFILGVYIGIMIALSESVFNL